MKRLELYRQMLRLYPKAFRDEYTEQMSQTLADMIADQPNKLAKLNTWLWATFNLPASIAQQNIMNIGDIMTQQTPYYIKRNALVGVALIVPFFAIVLSRLLQNNNLASNEIFQSSLYLSFILLPLGAFILATITLIKWSKDDGKSLWLRLVDVRHSWLLVAIGVMALGILMLVFFHDSTHCIVQNPIRTIHNPHQTYQCIKSGFLGGK